MGCGRSSSKRGVYSSPGTPQGTTVSDHHHLNRNKRQRPQSADRGKYKNQSRDRQTETTDQAVKDKTAKPAGQGGQQQRGPREDMQGGRLWSETLEGLQTVAPILQTDRREDLEETGAFLEICNSQEWTGRNRRSDRPVTSSETKLVVRLPANKSLGPESFMRGLYQTHRQIILILLKLPQKTEQEGTLFSSFYDATITLIPKSGRHYKKKKQLQVSIYDEHRSENPQKNISKQNSTIKKDHGEFSGGQVIRTLRFHCWGWRFNPCRGIKIPQAMKYGKKKKKKVHGHSRITRMLQHPQINWYNTPR